MIKPYMETDQTSSPEPESYCNNTRYYNHNYNCRVAAHTADNPDFNSFSYIRFLDCCAVIRYDQYGYYRHSFHVQPDYCSGNYFPAGSYAANVSLCSDFLLQSAETKQHLFHILPEEEYSHCRVCRILPVLPPSGQIY